MFRLVCSSIIAACLLVSVAPTMAPAQPDSASTLGTIKPRFTYQKSVIAVPTMTQAPAGAEVITQVIRRDLELTGVFQLTKDARAVNQQRLKDAQAGSIDFAAWMSGGVEHLLVTEVVTAGGGRVKMLVQLFDVNSGQAIINRHIEGPDADLRMLAHRISDEVVAMTQTFEGFAQTRILFTNEQTRGVREVALMDADGFNARTLTSDNSTIQSPVWGHNGTEVYFASWAGNLARIYGVQLSSGTRWAIAGYGGTNHSAAWSPAAGRMVMVLSRDGNSELYTAARDGSGLTRITQSKETEGSPTWSPEGSRIAYVRNDGNSRAAIFIANADGSGARRLSIPGPWVDAPAWCPDGQRIAFVSRINGRSEIYTVNTDGSNIRRLTEATGDNESPSWAPNGVHVAFASNRTGRWQIYLMLDDGSNQMALTETGNNRQPDWGPAPK